MIPNVVKFIEAESTVNGERWAWRQSDRLASSGHVVSVWEAGNVLCGGGADVCTQYKCI